MEGPCHGAQNARRLFLYQLLKANTSPLPTQQRRPCGFVNLSCRFLEFLSMQRSYFLTTSPPLPLPKNISIMPTQNTLTSIFTLSDGSLKMVNYGLSTALLKKW